MTRRLFNTSALLLATAAAALLGACKANDTAGDTGTRAPQSATKKAEPTAGTTAGTTTGTTQVDADGVRRVTVAELQKMLEDGRVAIYDTRARETYEHEHIKGALSMPLSEVAARMSELPRDKTLVFYCT